MSEWGSIYLGDLCTIKTGKKDVNEGNPYGQFPFFTCSRDVSWSDEFSFNTEAILIAGNGDVGNLHCYKGKFEAYQRTYVLDNFSVNIHYVFQYLEGKLLAALQKEKVGTSIPYIKLEHLRDFPIWLPLRKDKQKKIATILQTIDKTIEKTEALIEKYQQIKAGLMHDLFTRGITADGKLRPPREQAPELYRETQIGWIPKEWEVSLLKKVCNWFSGGTPSRRKSTWWKGEIPWLSPKDMKSFELTDTEEHVTRRAALSGSRLMPPNTIFFVVRGMILAHTFPVVLSCGEFCFNQDIKAVSGKNTLDNRFLAYWFDAHSYVFLRKTTEATHGTKRFDMKDLYEMSICVPQTTEQKLLIELLNIFNNRLNGEKKYLEKLVKTKLGLMQDLLTGKVQVKIDESESGHV